MREVWKVKVQIGEDEQLIPKDVAPVGLAVPATSWDTDIQIDGVLRHCLTEMELVEVQDHRLVVVRPGLEVETIPEQVPSERMGLEELVEGPQSLDPGACRPSRLGDRMIP